MLRLGLIQFSTGLDIDENLRRLRALTEQAVAKGAALVAFPEMAYLTGNTEQCRPSLDRYAEVLGTLSSWAKELRVHLAPGTLREPVAAGSDRAYNTLPVFGPDGKLLARYRKIFLFRANVPGDRVYEERAHIEAGSEVVTVVIGGVTVGLSVCFDLRFPELFRALRRRGAQLVLVPSAFTAVTGKAHWEPLLRARAIENQCFVAAPAQTGLVGDGRPTWGHSLVVGPWGEPLLEMGTEEGVAVVDVDPAAIGEASARVAAWDSRREDLFPI